MVPPPLNRALAFLSNLTAVCLLALAAFGCNGTDEAPAPPPPQPARRDAAAPAVAGTRVAQVYLPRWFDDDSLGLQGLERQLPAGENVARATLEALIQGPTGLERANNVQYALDRGTRILGLSLNDGTAVIELDSEGLDRIHGRPFSELAFWSLVFTMTEAPGIESVTLVKDGTPLAALGDPPFTLPTQASRSQAPPWVQPRAS